jgi:hypothetical protein
MSVCCECFVLTGRVLCDELITRPEQSYRLCCVILLDLENLKNQEAMTRVGSQGHKKNKPDDGYILGETCSFSIINKLVCSDRIFRNYVYNFYVDEE